MNETQKKGYEAQSEYFQNQLDILIQKQDQLKKISNDGENLLAKAKDILPGTSTVKRNILSRRKKDNRQKLTRQKNKHLTVACEKLLKKVLIAGVYKKCCPTIFSFNSKYKITSNDTNMDGLKHIRPRQEAVKKLSGCGFLMKPWQIY